MSLPKKNLTHANPSDIKLVIFDIDGVLTDCTLLYGEHGEMIKPFNAKDGIGIKLLHENDVQVAVITAKNSLALARRMHDLKIQHFYPDCYNKAETFAQLRQSLNIQNDVIAYVGDDVLDLPVMEQVGLAITPADGYQLVKNMAHIVTKTSGGKGVVREVADLLVGARTDLCKAYLELVKVKKELVQ